MMYIREVRGEEKRPKMYIIYYYYYDCKGESLVSIFFVIDVL